MPESDELAISAARQYYEDGRTMAAIAHDLRTSRSSVSRLLAHAREVGLVQIRILPPRLRVDSLERRIAERHGVRARVVAIPEDTPSDERYARTAHAGALAVADLMDSDAVLALSWGTMVNAISTQLPSKPCTNSRIVQANGLGQSDSGIHYSFRMLERFASAFGSSVQQLPFPIFLDSARSKDILEQERMMRHVRHLIAGADVFLFNVGTVQEGVPSHPYLSGYFLDDEEFRELREDGAVGDIATTFMNDAGDDTAIAMNDRSTGPSLATIREVRRRVCVTCGSYKLRALEAALRAGLVTDLVIDEITADALVR